MGALLDTLRSVAMPAAQARGSYLQGQDEEKRQSLLDQMKAATTNAQLARESAQTDDYRSQVALRNSQSDAQRQKLQGNRRAYNALSQLDPTHPLVGQGYDDGTDYLSELHNTQTLQLGQKQNLQRQKADYNTLRLEAPDHPLAKVAFDDQNPANYSAALQDARLSKQQLSAGDLQDKRDKAAETRAQIAADGRAPKYVWATNPDGKTVYVTQDEANRSGYSQPSKSAGSASAQTQQARLLAAVSEARLADERMRKFEDGLLNGKDNIGVLDQFGGNLMTNLSGSHEMSGALAQATSESGLNALHPEYAQYLRDAQTVGRAEQMMSPRGGNETMVRANSLLARAGAGARKATIDASRQARQALFGKAGGIEQALTPAQSAKLDAGLATIKSGNINATVGSVPVVDPKAAKTPAPPYGIFTPPDTEEDQ